MASGESAKRRKAIAFLSIDNSPVLRSWLGTIEDNDSVKL